MLLSGLQESTSNSKASSQYYEEEHKNGSIYASNLNIVHVYKITYCHHLTSPNMNLVSKWTKGFMNNSVYIQGDD